MSNHDWQHTGVTIDMAPSFSEEACTRCGCVAWGGRKTGEFVPETCPGNPEDFRDWYRKRVAEHNRGTSMARFHQGGGDDDILLSDMVKTLTFNMDSLPPDEQKRLRNLHALAFPKDAARSADSD